MRCASGSVIATSREPPRLSLPPTVATPETVYCLAGASDVTVTFEPGFQPYFLAVPRSIATWSAFCGGAPSAYSSIRNVLSVEVETISVGGPLETIALPLRSTSVPSADTLPSAFSTPGTVLTCSSADAGIVGGSEKSALTAWWVSTDTSTPFWVRSNRSLNEASIVSVNTSVPTTNATPMTTANPVSTDRSLRVSRPFKANFVTTAPPS